MNYTKQFTKLVAPMVLTSSVMAFLMTTNGCKDGRVTSSLTTRQEKDIGSDYASQIESRIKIDMDGKINRRMLDICLPIFEQANKDRPDVGFRIRVVDDPELNAFSLPGGYIYINSGLLDKLGKDDDAIACVIAHECGHVVHRDVVNQMADGESKGLLVDLAAILTRNYTVAQVGGLAAEMQQLHFSRQDEYGADRLGEKYAYNAGYDPYGMIRTFKVLSVEAQKHGKEPAYFQDHPINQNRTLRAREQLRELRAGKGQYVSDKYREDGDRIAAQKAGIDYQALVFASQQAIPIANPSTTSNNAPIIGKKL